MILVLGLKSLVAERVKATPSAFAARHCDWIAPVHFNGDGHTERGFFDAPAAMQPIL